MITVCIKNIERFKDNYNLGGLSDYCKSIFREYKSYKV